LLNIANGPALQDFLLVEQVDITCSDIDRSMQLDDLVERIWSGIANTQPNPVVPVPIVRPEVGVHYRLEWSGLTAEHLLPCHGSIGTQELGMTHQRLTLGSWVEFENRHMAGRLRLYTEAAACPETHEQDQAK